MYVPLAQVLLLILKWGGELTVAGKRQAEELGRAFRCMYPGGEGEYASLPGSGFLRLHSTYRHDLKVYASDEGRVQMTAAAFTKVGSSHGYNVCQYMCIHVAIQAKKGKWESFKAYSQLISKPNFPGQDLNLRSLAYMSPTLTTKHQGSSEGSDSTCRQSNATKPDKQVNFVLYYM